MKVIKYSKQAVKALRKMPVKAAREFHKAFDDMAKGQPEKHQIQPMHGKEKHCLKVRKRGLRAVVEWIDNGNTLMVLRIKPRGDVYK